jgi:cysteine desulfurase
MNYFDHAASSVIYPEVLDILSQALRDDFANPSSQHILGHALNEKILSYKGDFLKALSANRQDSFIFTSSATESNNTVVKGLTLSSGDTVLYSKADHPSITATAESLVDINLKEIILNSEGRIDVDTFISMLDSSVRLVLLTHVNNQSGVIADIDLLAKLVKEKTKAHVHVDAVQAFGKIKINVGSHIDSMSVTSHKIGGPKGIAGLYLRKGHAVKPLLLGGGQEDGFRSSTVAFPLIVGFHKAMSISLTNRELSFEDVSNLNAVIKSKLISALPMLQFPFSNTSPYIVSFIFPKISSDIILRHLEMHEVYISSTSACSSRISGFNSSLKAMQIPEKFHKNFLRISLGPKTTEVEVSTLIKEFIQVWDSLKHIR